MQDTGLITSAVITTEGSTATFALGAGLPAWSVLSETSLLFSLEKAILQNSFTILTVKHEYQDAVQLLAQIKLDSIAAIISQTMQDGDI